MSEIEALNPRTTSGRMISPSEREAVVNEIGTPTQTRTGLTEWQVVQRSIHDGDTIRATNGNEEIRVRFACIDAPELKQPLGEASRNTLRNILKKADYRVDLRITNTDRYGRKVAEVWTGNTLVQETMTRKGMAYAYRKFANNCPSFAKVDQAEQEARKEGVGVWKSDQIKPWDFRRMNR
ncbi:micrococcal nuclease-like nuclease [Synechococcus sp. PCC 6312]|nr:micrococcal nuclease-like nuclease [Synechococcus sp. PCC 6312]